MATNLNELSAFTELSTAFEAVTDLDIENAERGLDPPVKGESPIGVIHDAQIRRMYVTSRVFAHRAGSCMLESEFRAPSADAKTKIDGEVARLTALAELARDFFWTCAKTEMGAWDSATVGIRKGWMFVSRPKSSKHPLLAALGLK